MRQEDGHPPGQAREFLACSGYPQCKTTFDFSRDEKGNIIPEEPAPDPVVTCEKCGAPMPSRRASTAPSWPAPPTPSAATSCPWTRTAKRREAGGRAVGEDCPKCGAPLVIKPTRSGGASSPLQLPQVPLQPGPPVGWPAPCAAGAWWRSAPAGARTSTLRQLPQVRLRHLTRRCPPPALPAATPSCGRKKARDGVPGLQGRTRLTASPATAWRRCQHRSVLG